MPDWTWQPVARPIVSALPPSTGKRLVLRFAAALSRIPGLIQWFGQLRPPGALRRELFGAPMASPVFVAAGIDLTGETLAALSQLGVGAVEVGPAETSADIEHIAQALDRVHLQEGVQVWVRLRVADTRLSVSAIGPLAGRANALVIDSELPAGMAAVDLRRMFGGAVLRVERLDQPATDDGWDGVLVEGTTAQLLESAAHRSGPTKVMFCVATDGAPADLAALALSGANAVGLSGSRLAEEGPGFAGRINAALLA